MELKIDPAAEQTILSALRDGDHRQAGRLMVQNHGVAVFEVCHQIVQDGLVAEDLTQAVFARAFALLPGFGGELSSRDWLMSIARQCAAEHEPGSDGGKGDNLTISDSLRRRLEVLASAL